MRGTNGRTIRGGGLRPALVILGLLGALTTGGPAESRGQVEGGYAPGEAGGVTSGAEAQSFEGLVAEAWTAVDTSYYDPGFHGVDWEAVRDTFMSRSYPTREAAHEGIRRMLGRLGNPATRFLTREQASALVTEFQGQPHEGVGLLEVLSVDTNVETGEIVVVTPVPGAPAARAGLRPGDVIVSVDGRSARELTLAGTASRLRGPAGTGVALEIRRSAKSFEVTLPREEITAIEPVEGFAREVDGLTVGYLGLRQFLPGAQEKMAAVVEELKREGAQAWVLDLRSNPGGYVPVVQQIGGIFLGPAPLARLRTRAPEAMILAGLGETQLEGPVVVLVDGGSASAAEVLSSALQHHGRATLVGTPTFGKGLAHGFVPLSDGSAVTPTMGRLESLGDRDILTQGVVPDVGVVSDVWPVLDPEVEPAGPRDRAWRRAVEVLAEAVGPVEPHPGEATIKSGGRPDGRM